MRKKKKNKYQTLLKLSSKTTNYPKNFINKINTDIKFGRKRIPKTRTSTVIIPYRAKTADNIRRVLSKLNIRVFFKTSNTLRNNLVHIKDQMPKDSLYNFVYKIKCLECGATYIGQTSPERNQN
uniref:Uncharacterized protein n=1 Tax=Trichobilharzia regenti TaxID=157069 RepID=A0AA85KA89_TRIRE|nr:unnamed protein product [Trichobilharzia regenti]